MKHIDSIVITFALLLIVGLGYSEISVHPVLAAQPDPCFLGDCTNKNCGNTPEKLTASCCWSKPGVIPAETVCQTCQVNTGTGEFENCTSVASKRSPDSGSIAPPPSTEKCPDNSAIDSKGNCTPMKQLPDDSSDGDNKPKFPRGDILSKIQTNPGTQLPS